MSNLSKLKKLSSLKSKETKTRVFPVRMTNEQARKLEVISKYLDQPRNWVLINLIESTYEETSKFKGQS